VRVIAVYNIKGGVGKTASAVNLAWLSAQSGARTLLWDLDPQGAASFTFRIKPGVTGGGERIVKDDDAVLMSIKGTDYDRLDVLPADFSYRNLDLVLNREKKRMRKLAQVLRPLADEYDTVILDCAPGISLTSENIFAAADVLLVPTIPTVLSLRTLGRLLKHLKQCKQRPSFVLPFFCMVDRRKSLHKKVCTWALENSRGFLKRSIPYASLVEQMGVRRKPLLAFAPRSAPAKAYASLWAEITERLQQKKRPTAAPSRKTVRTMLEELQPPEATRKPAPAKADSDISGLVLEPDEPTVSPPAEPAPVPPAATELEFKVRVKDLDDFAALARVLPALGDVLALKPAEQVNHFFDTSDWALQRNGCILRLREENGGFVITAKGPSGRTVDQTLTHRAEEEVTVDAARARQIMAGKLSPLDALLLRHGGQHTTLTSEIAKSLGDRPLFHVGAFRNERRRAGPVAVPAADGEDLHMLFEMDRTQFPHGRVDHEIEIEIRDQDQDPARCRDALMAVFAEAGILWRSAPSKAARFFGTLARDSA
jgi:chromosome partitioning protein